MNLDEFYSSLTWNKQTWVLCLLSRTHFCFGGEAEPRPEGELQKRSCQFGCGFWLSSEVLRDVRDVCPSMSKRHSGENQTTDHIILTRTCETTCNLTHFMKHTRALIKYRIRFKTVSPQIPLINTTERCRENVCAHQINQL